MQKKTKDQESCTNAKSDQRQVHLAQGPIPGMGIDRVQTDFKKNRNTYESAYKISIRNHKEEDIVVSVVEMVPGDWKILETTHEFTKEAAHRIRFDRIKRA